LRELDEIIAALRAIDPGTPASDPTLAAVLDRHAEISQVMGDSLPRLASASDSEIEQISDRLALVGEAITDIAAGGFWRTPD
jgi:hypothetical protein